MLRLVRVDEFLLGKAMKYFSYDYTDELKEKSNFEESVIGRYLIAKIIYKKFQIKNFIARVDEHGVPIQENGICWSLSHKRGYVLVGVDRKRIGVDLEVFKDRDASLLNKFSMDEWKLIGDKSLKNFYMLWTAKESLIKYLFLGLDYMEEINTSKIINIEEKLDGLKFLKKIYLSYAGKEFVAKIGQNREVFYSFTL